jgi:factor associated with neutral sphingomyelinase activation
MYGGGGGGGAAAAPRRFSLLLLEEGELYVADYVASCAWPPDVPGNALRAPRLPGHLRLATRSLFFEPDDARVPIVRRIREFLTGKISPDEQD